MVRNAVEQHVRDDQVKVLPVGGKATREIRLQKRYVHWWLSAWLRAASIKRGETSTPTTLAPCRANRRAR